MEAKKPGAVLPGREKKPLGLKGLFMRAYAMVDGGMVADKAPAAQPVIQTLPRGVVEAYAYTTTRLMVR